jgi:hypothetical protein
MSAAIQDVIMILGAPRSGTSWVGKIFDSHPDVLYRHEPDTVLEEPGLPFIIPPEEGTRYEAVAAAYLRRLLQIPTIKSAAHVPTFPKSYFPAAIGPLRRGLVHVARLTAAAAGERLASARLPDLFDVARHPRRRFVLKTVSARGRMEAFLRAAPMMRVVFLLRHPGGQAASMLRGMRTGKMERRNAFISDVARTPTAARYGLTEQGLAQAGDAAQWTWNWVAMNELATTALARHDATLTMTYEDICADPIRRAKELFAFAQLDWNRQTEDFINRSTQGSGTDRYHSVYRNTAEAATKWRIELSEHDQQAVIAILQQTPFAKFWPETASLLSADAALAR